MTERPDHEAEDRLREWAEWATGSGAAVLTVSASLARDLLSVLAARCDAPTPEADDEYERWIIRQALADFAECEDEALHDYKDSPAERDELARRASVARDLIARFARPAPIPATEGRQEDAEAVRTVAMAIMLVRHLRHPTPAFAATWEAKADEFLAKYDPEFVASVDPGTAGQRFMVRDSDGPCADGPTEWFVLALDEDDQEVWPPVAACPDEVSAHRVAAALAPSAGTVQPDPEVQWWLRRCDGEPMYDEWSHVSVKGPDDWETAIDEAEGEVADSAHFGDPPPEVEYEIVRAELTAAARRTVTIADYPQAALGSEGEDA